MTVPLCIRIKRLLALSPKLSHQDASRIVLLAWNEPSWTPFAATKTEFDPPNPPPDEF